MQKAILAAVMLMITADLAAARDFKPGETTNCDHINKYTVRGFKCNWTEAGATVAHNRAARERELAKQSTGAQRELHEMKAKVHDAEERLQIEEWQKRYSK